MTPVAIIALVDAAVTLLARIGPVVQALKQSKEMSKAEEALLDAKIAKLKELPHWN